MELRETEAASDVGVSSLVYSLLGSMLRAAVSGSQGYRGGKASEAYPG